MTSNKHYLHNPKVHADRQLANSDNEWVKSFSCTDMKPLIICRGPIRKEAMDVFDEMGINGYGILLSEKDSITYANALAPELRKLTDPGRVHRVPDYTGADKEERQQRIRQIIAIAHENGYDSIFTGYGFMAEDEEMVRSMENAGLNFIGPCADTVRDAGLKDEAKRTALAVGVSVTPGIDNASTLTVIEKYKDLAGLKKLVADEALNVEPALLDSKDKTLEEKANAILSASFEKGIDLFDLEELGEQLKVAVAKMFADYPENRVRMKAISGGGGKGQRILPAPSSYEGSLEERIEQATARAPELALEILNEVKCNGVGDNKNILAELNIETTRHQEIQVIGNGDWCMTMGGRDCSLQMHEQKLLEVSVTIEELKSSITEAEQRNAHTDEIATLKQDLVVLEKMEAEAARFGAAVGLNSVSTFECIVDGPSHFFMEMNTRIQVEHRVTELCYGLEFSNPANPSDSFVVNSLVEAMVLIARHSTRLPLPKRVARDNASVEARLNATNQALQPHAGGVITQWSNAVEGEIRDDQGISVHNPDTDVFMKYHLAGAYDSNIALLLTTGQTRLDTYQAMAETIRQTTISGSNLCTNLEFHYGLVNWFIGQGINARPTTRFIVPYLTAVGQLKDRANNIDIPYAFQQFKNAYVQSAAHQTTSKALATAIDRKSTLLMRPIEMLLSEPHIYSGWLSLNKANYSVHKGEVTWSKNPLEVLSELYHYLNMDYVDSAPALYQIWDHDDELLSEALAFYADLEQRLETKNWDVICNTLQSNTPPAGFDAPLWDAVVNAHIGFQAGVDLLSILPYIADQTDFFSLVINSDLSIEIPDALLDEQLQEQMAKVLVPPPVAKSDEIVAESGGMFYPREAPGMEEFIKQGEHFNAGDPLYIVEVMKMFNKVYAPFSGTIDKVLLEGDGVIIKKGQPLFKITPDEVAVFESDEEIMARKRKVTGLFLAANA
ncbi:biotin carboxylase C-terminal domain-containing protein [Sinobacterium caligoides]|uniref:Biotin carboxylase C-terminal domain-containing protein n=1 Tax=Sinobacterium caligoides TaxID=933926 RepID=A0A3N2DXP8_9GAMM|nr:biotin/lipoyl-containing protein [Sinobacterium caligoides]ROS04601.1 biotin carboxylase C-terminal domain-containing protein [Sinobacterium caligoides]